MLISFWRWIARKIFSFFGEIGSMTVLLYQMVENTRYVYRDRRLIVDQMQKVGVLSLPLVSVISVFTGAVSSWQAAYQLRGVMGGLPMDFLGAGVSAAILIELSPVLAGIVVAGRVGASIAAELGTMQVTEQIDALETLAIDPVRYLAAPRFVAGWTMLPILVIYADFIAHAGAYVVASFFLGIPSATFFNSVQNNFSLQNLFSGLIKALFFGGGTALVGCSIGFRTTGGAEGVGKATIKAFVFSSAFILIADYLLAMILF